MSILKLMRDRQMYKYGHRVGFEPGGMAGEHGMGAGVGADGQTDGQRGGGGGDGRPNMADIAGPVTGPPDMSHFGDTGDIVQADFTPYNQRPDTITDFKDNYIANFKSQGLKNLIPGMGISNLINTINQTNKARDLLGFGPTVGPGPSDGGGDGQGIMNLYQPNMLNVAGAVVDEDDEDDEEEITPFKNRFELSADATKAKGIERLIQDQAIAEMVSRLYT